MNDRMRKFIVKISNPAMKNGTRYYSRTVDRGPVKIYIATLIKEFAGEVPYTEAHIIKKHFEQKHSNNKYTTVRVISVDLYDGLLDDIEDLETMG